VPFVQSQALATFHEEYDDKSSYGLADPTRKQARRENNAAAEPGSFFIQKQCLYVVVRIENWMAKEPQGKHDQP